MSFMEIQLGYDDSATCAHTVTNVWLMKWHSFQLLILQNILSGILHRVIVEQRLEFKLYIPQTISASEQKNKKNKI